MKRILFFLFTNLSIVVLLGILLNLIGVQYSAIQSLLITAFLFGFSGSFISLLISKKTAIKSVKGEIIKHPRNDTEKWLINTISEQVKKIDIAMPQVAIYRSVDINAFATGVHRNNSMIAVSTGLLQNMKKEEAEAVIAHEVSHIVNGDMVTMTLIQGITNTFVIFISHIVSQIINNLISGSSHEKKNNSNSLVYFGIKIFLEMVLGVLAILIVMWFSRHREFHADADAAKLVGYDKMISALQRLKTSCEPQEPSIIMSFCINGKSNGLSELFMTHPLLNKRIEALQKRRFSK